MKIIIFILLTTAGVFFLPNNFFATFVERVIPIGGDGEYEMDNFEMSVLLIKILMCSVGVGAVIILFRTC